MKDSRLIQRARRFLPGDTLLPANMRSGVVRFLFLVLAYFPLVMLLTSVLFGLPSRLLFAAGQALGVPAAVLNSLGALLLVAACAWLVGTAIQALAWLVVTPAPDTAESGGAHTTADMLRGAVANARDGVETLWTEATKEK